jgi:hypothetical protein
MPAGVVIVYFSRLGAPMYAHERTTLFTVAKTIAQIKNYEFLGPHGSRPHDFGKVFFVPDDTLMIEEALSLGAYSADELF